MTDIAALIEQATAKGTFSVLEAAKGRSYPQDHVTVYTAAEEAYAVGVLERQIANLDETQTDLINQLDERIAELKETVAASALTFHMRGIGRGAIDSIMKEARVKFPWTDKTEPDPVDQGEGAHWCNNRYVAEAITKVVDADNNEDTHHWTVDEIEEMRGWMPDESFEKIYTLSNKVSFASLNFDETVNADFS